MQKIYSFPCTRYPSYQMGEKWTNMSSAERGEKGEGLPDLSFTSIKVYVLNRDTIQVCRNIYCAGDRGEEM